MALDIQLNVKNCKNLYDSFKEYVSMEVLEGENKYHAEGYGLQDANKGVIFESFPPVLHLQLKRFEYDFMRDTMVKVYIYLYNLMITFHKKNTYKKKSIYLFILD